MIERMIILMASALFLRLMLVLVDLALRPAAELKLSLFRPYRRDPWPIGVQEDDDLRFRWRTALATASGAAPVPWTIADREGRRTPPPEAPMAAGVITIEDVAAGAVATQRPGRVTVHRPRR